MDKEMLEVLKEMNSNLVEIKGLLLRNNELLEKRPVVKEVVQQPVMKNKELTNSLYNCISKLNASVENTEETETAENEIDYSVNTAESLEKLVLYLDTKKIKINNIEDEAINYSLLKLSMYMGERYKLVYPLLEKLKPNLSSGKFMTFCIKNYTQESVSSMCQLCTLLYQLSFLQRYEYRKSPQFIINLLPNRMPIAINFLTGHWFEMYMYQVINNIFISRQTEEKPISIELAIHRNIQIQLENGNYFELDLMVNIGDEFYWIECKTANYQEHIYKYSEFAKRYRFDFKKSFMVLLDEDDNLHSKLNGLYDIQIHSPKTFKEEFEIILDNMLALE